MEMDCPVDYKKSENIHQMENGLSTIINNSGPTTANIYVYIISNFFG